tara:strand:- start:229 stop:636 length:408 start_codon:yes stop_codon:yes gene_type:complete
MIIGWNVLKMTLEEIIKKIYKAIFRSKKNLTFVLSLFISYTIASLILHVLEFRYSRYWEKGLGELIYEFYRYVFLNHDFTFLYEGMSGQIYEFFNYGNIPELIFFIFIVIFILIHKFIGKKISIYILEKISLLLD